MRLPWIFFGDALVAGVHATLQRANRGHKAAVVAPGADTAESTRVSARRQWIPELDGLRGLAAVLVVLHHGRPDLFGWVGLANLGVALFFSLSGFLIWVLSEREFERTGALDIRRFYLRRVLRIWPLYIVVVIGMLLLHGSPPPVQHTTIALLVGITTWEFIGKYGWAFPTFTTNWALAFNFVEGWYWWAPDVLSVTWSIAVEEQFYLLFPLLFLPIARRWVPAWAVLLSLLALALGLRWWHITLTITHPNVAVMGSSGGLYYASYAWIESFMFGAIAGAMYLRRAGTETWLGMLSLFSVSLLALVWVAPFWAGGLWVPYRVETVFHYSAISALLAAVLYACVSARTPVSVLLAWAPMRAIGGVSYGVYLVHLSAIKWTLWWHEGVPHRFTGLPTLVIQLEQIVYALVLAIAVASLLHVLVERPFLMLRGKRPTVVVPWRWTLGISLALLVLTDVVWWRVWELR